MMERMIRTLNNVKSLRRPFLQPLSKGIVNYILSVQIPQKFQQ